LSTWEDKLSEPRETSTAPAREVEVHLSQGGGGQCNSLSCKKKNIIVSIENFGSTSPTRWGFQNLQENNGTMADNHYVENNCTMANNDMMANNLIHYMHVPNASHHDSHNANTVNHKSHTVIDLTNF
jgi:hypothetical protein